MSFQQQEPNSPQELYDSLKNCSTQKEAIELALKYSYKSYKNNKKCIKFLDEIIEGLKERKMDNKQKEEIISEAIKKRKSIENNNKVNQLNISLLKFDLETI